MISDCFYVFKSFSPAIRPEESFFVLHLSAGNKLESKWERGTAVSYTHLDVYKRQPVDRHILRIGIFSLIIVLLI